MSDSSTSLEVMGENMYDDLKVKDCKYQVSTIKRGGGHVMVGVAFSVKGVGLLLRVYIRVYKRVWMHRNSNSTILFFKSCIGNGANMFLTILIHLLNLCLAPVLLLLLLKDV